MNLSGGDPWERQSRIGGTRRGFNGLYDMGGNVWEWLADRRGGEALTAGGSWWYGASAALMLQTSVNASLSYAIDKNWAITARASYKRLMDDFADSPITKAGSENQFFAGGVVVYRW